MKFEETQSRKINRTVCIGLGGTGRDVLMRIRRLIVERYGDFKQLPVISFVHIDTDNGTSNTTGLKTGNTYHGIDLRFSDAEKVAATMARFEVDNMVKELSRNASNYDGTPGVYSNISSWFPPQLLKDIKAIQEGAQGIRPVGRLAFFHNYKKIKNAIELAEQRTLGHEAFMIRKNWHINPKLNIFVVGSLCGGTGSGTFLDTAYCLRQMYGNDGAQIVGYFVISPELYGNALGKSANAYAALKELNYYATAGTVFKAEYDLYTLEFVEESSPPFEYIYLVSNRTAKDYKILEKSKLCNIIAHKITLDFAGELATEIELQKDTLSSLMIPTDLHPRPNVQRYLTFGLAEIYFPREVAVQVSLNRIKIKLVNFWLQGEGQSADPSNLLVSFLDRWYDSTKNENGFVNKLQQATTDGSKTFSNALSSWKNRLESNIAEIHNSDERLEVISQLGKKIKQEFLKVQPGETDSSRGLWLTNLKQQREHITAEYIRDIDKYLTQLLNPNSIDFSLTNSRGWLEALTTELNKSYRELEDSINGMKSIHSLEAVERKWNDAKQTIDDIESKKGLPFFNKNKTSQVQEEAQRIVGQVSKLIKDNYQYSLFQEALTIVKALQHHVSELTNKCSSFSNLLNNVKLEYEKTEDELKLQDVDEMSGEAIFADADTDDCYRNLLPKGDRAAQLALVSSKITAKVGLGTESLASCLEHGVVDKYSLQSEINSIVDSEFSSRSLSTVQSAVKRFLESYPLSDRAIRLEQIIRESEPLLPLNLADPYFNPDTGKSLNIIGFKDTDKPEITQFKNILAKDLGIKDNNLKPIQAEDEIILVNEYGAFPLRLIRGLDKMREHYQRHKSHGNFLHNDYRTQFIDPIPPDGWEMKRLQDIFYPSLAFELLPYNSQTKEYEFQYYDKFRDAYEVTSLSYVWDEALEKLASIQDMVTALDNKLKEAIADLTQNPQNWHNHYLPKLRQFVTTVDNLPENDPNYLYKEIVVGSRASIDRRQQEGIINRFWQKMQDVVREEMEKQKQQQQQEILPSNSTVNPQLKGSNNFKSDQQNIDTNYIHPENSSVLEAEINEAEQDNYIERMAELKELIQMKKDGFLSDTQFEAAKQKILGI